MLDRRLCPVLFLWADYPRNAPPADGVADRMEVLGGAGLYWVASTFDSCFQRQLLNPAGGESEVKVRPQVSWVVSHHPATSTRGQSVPMQMNRRVTLTRAVLLGVALALLSSGCRRAVPTAEKEAHPEEPARTAAVSRPPPSEPAGGDDNKAEIAIKAAGGVVVRDSKAKGSPITMVSFARREATDAALKRLKGALPSVSAVGHKGPNPRRLQPAVSTFSDRRRKCIALADVTRGLWVVGRSAI